MPHHSSLQVRKMLKLFNQLKGSLIHIKFKSDGLGRTGTYIMIDMVLNKITRGAKEIDLAATLEYLRDQRAGMVKNKVLIPFTIILLNCLQSSNFCFQILESIRIFIWSCYRRSSEHA